MGKRKKIQIETEVYDELKKYADAKGLTVEDYITRLVRTNDMSEVKLE